MFGSFCVVTRKYTFTRRRSCLLVFLDARADVEMPAETFSYVFGPVPKRFEIPPPARRLRSSSRPCIEIVQTARVNKTSCNTHTHTRVYNVKSNITIKKILLLSFWNIRDGYFFKCVAATRPAQLTIVTTYRKYKNTQHFNINTCNVKII